MTDENKRCAKCGDTKAITEFYRVKAAKGGLSGYCKKCKISLACAAQRIRRETDPGFVEKQRQRSLDFHKGRPLWKKAQRANLRAEEYGVPGRITEDILLVMLDEQNGLCYYCSAPLGTGRDRWVEHKQPLSRGGDNTAENVCWACASCNMSKGDLTEDEYRDTFSGKLLRGLVGTREGAVGDSPADRGYERLLFAVIYPDLGNIASRHFIPFHVARSFVHSMKFSCRRDFVCWARSTERPIDFPADPARVYGSLWQGWGDWLFAPKVDSEIA